MGESHEEILDKFFDQVDEVVATSVSQAKEKDRNDRTFRDITYKSSVLANSARSIWEAAMTTYGLMDSSKSSHELHDILLQLKELELRAPNELQKDVQKLCLEVSGKYDEAEKQERTFLGTVYQTKEERDEAERQYRSISEKAFSKQSAHSLESVKSVKKNIESNETIFPPVRDALLQKATEIENSLKEIRATQKAEKANKRKAIGIVIANLCYLIFTIWVIWSQKLFSIDSDQFGTISVFKAIYSDPSDVFDAAYVIVLFAIIISVYILQAIKKVAGKDTSAFYQIPSVVFALGLTGWGMKALFGAIFSFTGVFFSLLIISLIFVIVNSKST